MIKNFLSFSIAIVLFLSLSSIVKAQAVINEFSSNSSDDWVEIINIGAESVDLTNYIIRDSTDSNKIELTGSLLTDQIAVFGFSNRLDHDGDVIRVIRKVNGIEQSTADFTLCYGNQFSNAFCNVTNSRRVACIANTDISSVGSFPSNGGNTYDRFLTNTKGVTNVGAQLDPCPSPTSMPSNTPTNTPTPTVTILPTATNTVKPTNTPTKNITATDTPVPTDTPEQGDKLVLGSTDESDGSPTPNPIEESSLKSPSLFVLPIIFIILGVGFIGAAIFMVIKARRMEYHGGSNK